jgi:hypothetical protein
MRTVLDRPWTNERFLAWEDQQEGKYEFDGLNIVPMTGGTIAHQDIMFNLRAMLSRRQVRSSPPRGVAIPRISLQPARRRRAPPPDQAGLNSASLSAFRSNVTV